jgi:2-dehydro-3-deoxygluconokinase
MPALALRPAADCRFDILALGEVMLRLDPGEGRIRTARAFRAWEGGGEYNVARGLRRCFGCRAAVATAFADNDIGRLVEDFILQGGVDTSHIHWLPYDGIGRTVRNGLNFTERGFGVRGAVGVSDRGHTAASQIRRGDFDWHAIFGKDGVRWFHSGGIFAGLSGTTADVLIDAARAAHKHGTIVSYDLNYRPSLWQEIGGIERYREVNREIAPFVDVMIGSPSDLGYADGDFETAATAALKDFPNFRALATTMRTVTSATLNDWSGACWVDGKFYRSALRKNLEILDRVGGGDGFASGFIYGLMQFGDPQKAVEYGAAHGALAMTTPGDQSMASLAEVERLVSGGSARTER